MPSRRVAVFGLAAGALAAGAAARAGAAAPTSAVPGKVPAVSGPVSGGAKGWAFGAFPGDIGALGYQEEEYFLEGSATRFRPVGVLADDGLWTVEPSGQEAFKTRIVVRRPRDPSRFNGTVLVEWTNVSSGYEITFGDQPDVYRNGFAHVAVSAQRVGVHGFPENPRGLVQWDPVRYGALSVPGDSLSFDIYSQAARVLGANRPRGGVDPLGGLNVRKLIAIGGSQSAARLNSYINAIQPRDKLFDALMPTVSAGAGVTFEDFIMNPAKRSETERFRVKTRLRTLPVPVMVVNSESETLSFFPVRQPDGPRFRFWEIAGASHAPTPSPLNWPEQQWMQQRAVRDGVPPLARPVRGSDVQWRPTYDAAILHLHTWINGGPPPPMQPPIAVAGASPAILRDAHGNARGGVRLPDVEVPIATYHGLGDGAAGLMGRTVPFSPEKLKALYPTHADYVRKVSAAADAAGKGGVIPPYRVQEYKEEAKAANVSGA